MIKIYDRTYSHTEDELLQAASDNSWTVGDVMSAYTKAVKLTRVIEILKDRGDLNRWAIDNYMTEDQMAQLIVDEYSSLANLKVSGHLATAEVRAIVTIKPNVRLYLFLGVSNKERKRSQFEARITKLEKWLSRLEHS